MDARTKRTVYRLLAGFLAAGAGDAIVQFLSSDAYDYRHLLAALTVAAVLSLEQYLKSTDLTTAAPSVAAVNVALENQAASVPPPKIAINNNPPVVKPFDTL